MANLRLMHPQEIEVLFILPALRRELALEMKKQGLEQKKIAEMLCVTGAAISQYMKLKRARDVKFAKTELKAIKEAANRIKDKETMLLETQALLKLLKNTGVVCRMHKKLIKRPQTCKVCFYGR